jgi:hypothetical protein
MSNKFDQSAGAYAQKNAEVRAAPMDVISCPSDPGVFLNENDTVARSSYAGCHHDVEAPIDKDNHGLLFLNSSIRYADIYDGSSNTLLVGEMATFVDELGWVSGTRSTLRNTGSIEKRRPMSEILAEQKGEGASPEQRASTYVGGFGSHHPGVINAALADGSCRAIREDMDKQVLQRLGHRADGEIPKPL